MLKRCLLLVLVFINVYLREDLKKKMTSAHTGLLLHLHDLQVYLV